MANLCKVCQHPRRADIDAALLVHAQSYGGIGRKYGLQDDALRRHEKRHLHSSFRASQTLMGRLSVERLVNRLEQADAEIDRVIERARDRGDDRLALSAVRELRAGVEVLAKIGVSAEFEAEMREALEKFAEMTADAERRFTVIGGRSNVG